MKYLIGYITSWRRTLFFTFIFSMIIFGTVLSVCGAVLGAGLISNIISVGVLVLCMALIILVYADKWGKFTGYGTAAFDDGVFTYNDKKRHYNIKLSEIKKIDIEPIKLGEGIKNPIAYRVMIATGKKKYYIESDRALGREYKELEIYKLYVELQKTQDERR